MRTSVKNWKLLTKTSMHLMHEIISFIAKVILIVQKFSIAKEKEFQFE